MRAFAGLALALAAATVAGCTRSAPEQEAASTEVPTSLAEGRPAAPAQAGIGTPMAERVATLGLLNKRNNISQDIVLKPGEARRVGDVAVRLSACEKTAPWEDPPEEGAFVLVQVLERPRAGADPQWRQVFSGWLFKNSPSLNVVEHPIYDVWLKSCAMSFPGEEAKPAASSSNASNAAPRSPASPSPSASASLAPSPSSSPAATAPASAAR